MTSLGANRYGKSAIRLVRVIREPDRHIVRDLTVAIALEGGFEAAHVSGDNTAVIATDTMKNTVYAFAREHLTGAVESFALALARHFAGFEQVAHATVSADEHRWIRVPTEAGPAPDAFLRSGDYVRTTEVVAGVDGESVTSGVRDLVVMKTTRSAFRDFPRDRYTTLADTDDRLMATRMTAQWRYGDGGPADFDATFDAVGATMLDAFATHHSPSVQASIWIVGRAMLDGHPELESVRMVLPNLHHWLVDLAPFGQENPGEVFVATTEPHGLIDATVTRD